MENDDEYNDMEEAQLEQLEDATGGVSYGYPKPASKESVYKFFRHILDKEDSSKIGNLSSTELGQPLVSVRGLQNVALYADIEGWDKVSNYLKAEAEIILATSLSKKGFLPQLFVTQIKKDQKMKSSEEAQKKTWWGGNKPQQQER